LSQPAITPVAKSLYLCDGHIGYPGQKTDIIGLFSRIRPLHFPHVHGYFVVFAQLSAGLGQMAVYIDIRNTADGTLVRSTTAQLLQFPHRNSVVELAYTIRDCRFPQAGTYLVELFCGGQWVADTTLELL
jgi:hypothetical protein